VRAATRLLQPDDGLTIIAAALKLRSLLDSGYDCSHLAHVVYKQAGFPYEYATAAQLYSGVREFRRVMHPQPGDLVVFPDRGKNGHVGIMVSPAQHLFFSGLDHGPSVSSYTSRYWRARGYPHFFRYSRKVALKTYTASSQ
jgi:cell wall-associated NlpC family hydrolase